ncbi:alpha/beta hydrolase [Agaribacterium haliotis]|uniref:alpha/beta hydrolase n=1 Tax=Agaribacterium haliotis TaxID=2013869 RepID=UPI000BB537F7|nr:alpha/beta hydrolase-fold protein [Agaribacterium haliotis]
MKRLINTLLVISCGTLANVSLADSSVGLTKAAQPKLEKAGAVELTHSQSLSITSSDTGLEYDLLVRFPADYSTSTRNYPLVLLSDSDFSFPAVTAVSALMGGRDIESFIAVAVSYSKGHSAQLSRTRDYTPTYAPDESGAHSLEAQKHSGRAKAYMNFIEKDVFPALEQLYRVDTKKRIYVGHSFGALLGTAMLFERPQLFTSYILGSPSLWYDNRAIFAIEDSYAQTHKDLDAQVLMYIGSQENKNKHKNMVEDLYRFHQTLKQRSYPSLEIDSFEIQGASHFSTFSLMLVDALSRTLVKTESNKTWANKAAAKPGFAITELN